MLYNNIYIPGRSCCRPLIRICLLIFVSVLFVSASTAQYLPVSSVNFIDKYQINKAYAGISDSRMLVIGSRQQWINIDGRSKSFYTSFTTPFYNLKGGAGIEFSYQSMGAHSRFSYGISYNYLYSSDYGLISLGVGGSQSFITLDREKILTPDGIYSDGFYDSGDEYLSLLFGNSISLTNGRISLLFLTGDFEIGMEFDKAILLPEKTGISDRDLLKLNFQYHYNFNENISFRVNALFYSDYVVAQSDIGITSFINQNYVGGLNFRAFGKSSIESMGLMAGAYLSRNLMLVYAYDVVLNRFNEIGSSSHEIKLFIDFGRPDQHRKIPPMIYNPRLK